MLEQRGRGARRARSSWSSSTSTPTRAVAQTFRIQSIPAVKAFRDGQVVSEFVGAQPPAAVERVPRLAAARRRPTSSSREGDEESLRRAVELEPSRADAAVPLARLLHARGDDDGALALLKEVPGQLRRRRARGADRARARTGAQPDLQEAFAALDAGDQERALDLLIGALPSADGSRDDIRRVVVGILDELGVENPLARESRRRLAAALY